MAEHNIQINFPALIGYCRANAPQLEKFTKQAKHGELARLALLPSPDIGGMTIAVEPFATGYRDGQKLFADHLVLVGESPDAASSKNVALLQRLDEAGNLVCLSARSNGKIFGYLVYVLGPSLESPDTRQAQQTTFYADPAVPGLGLRIERAGLRALAERGVDEVWFQAGVRGDGQRMGTMFRRVGAAEAGAAYRLNLNELD
jgi:hypothetical protein